ncbi:MAG: cytochrome c biogenesis protein CcsA [Candidatus Lindowbacteria bacterium]|nr:cytochrome c biogenesis protein CcsA [Candidatus Lindowbacteria bacterium]
MEITIQRSKIIGAIAALFGLLGIFGFLEYAPAMRDADNKYLGESFRIFFIHVPSAWTSFVLFFGSFISGITYLARRKPFWDRLSASFTEVGMVYATIVIVTGPIWARAAWGTFWNWEPRLTSFMVLWIIYFGYLLLRHSIDETQLRAKSCAVMSVIAFVNVPIVFFAIRMWGTKSHPTPGPGYFQEPSIRNAIIFNFVALLVIAFHLVTKKMLTEKTNEV